MTKSLSGSFTITAIIAQASIKISTNYHISYIKARQRGVNTIFFEIHIIYGKSDRRSIYFNRIREGVSHEIPVVSVNTNYLIFGVNQNIKLFSSPVQVKIALLPFCRQGIVLQIPKKRYILEGVFNGRSTNSTRLSQRA